MIIKIWLNKIIIVAFLLFITAGCRDSALDNNLAILEEIGKKNPQEAYDSLLNLKRTNFKEADRVYYDFLSVKLADKAYILHRSDSVILPVIDYYSSHGNKDQYTEALYYGGRVYSDIGDYPRALSYFEDALKRIEEDPSKLLLKGNILSQTASLLHSLSLYEEAKKYLNKVLAIDIELKDSLNLMHDLRLLGVNNLNSKKYDEAEHNFKKALSLAEKFDTTSIEIYSAYLAGIKNFKMKPDSAVILLEDIPYKAENLILDDDYRQLVYSYASDIYRCADMPDSAYKYALKLVNIKDARNLRKGYAILLSEELKDVVPLDSIRVYASRYENLTEEYMSHNGDRNALIQNSLYNYSIVERDKEKALEKKRTAERWLAICVILLLMLAVGILYYRNKTNKVRLELREAIEKWRILGEQLDREREETRYRNATSDETEGETTPEAAMPPGGEETLRTLRERLTKELDSLYSNRKDRKPLSPVIAESEAYAVLRDHIENQRTIPDASPLWEKLHQAVTEAAPNFDKRVMLLSDGKVKDIDRKIMLLIKCGATPSQLSFLVAKSKPTLSYHRKMLGIRWLDNEIDPRLIDNLIYDL